LLEKSIETVGRQKKNVIWRSPSNAENLLFGLAMLTAPGKEKPGPPKGPVVRFAPGRPLRRQVGNEGDLMGFFGAREKKGANTMEKRILLVGRMFDHPNPVRSVPEAQLLGAVDCQCKKLNFVEEGVTLYGSDPQEELLWSSKRRIWLSS